MSAICCVQGQNECNLDAGILELPEISQQADIDVVNGLGSENPCGCNPTIAPRNCSLIEVRIIDGIYKPDLKIFGKMDKSKLWHKKNKAKVSKFLQDIFLGPNHSPIRVTRWVTSCGGVPAFSAKCSITASFLASLGSHPTAQRYSSPNASKQLHAMHAWMKNTGIRNVNQFSMCLLKGACFHQVTSLHLTP